MKIIVVSDSHGIYPNIIRAIKLHPDADLLLHLGDGTADLERIGCLKMKTLTVKGNFEDVFSGKGDGVLQTCFDAGGKRIFMCHGHRLNVRYGKERLVKEALEYKADIALYGHTHVKHNEYIPGNSLDPVRENGLYVFNPGSVSLPRDGIFASYGLIQIKENGILLSHGTIR